MTTTETADNESKGKMLEAVAERLLFFLSPANIRQDFFVRKHLLKDQKIPIEALLKFNTINKLTTSADDIVEAATTLCSEKLVVSENNEAIGLVEPFTMAQMDDNLPLSLYISNVPHSKTHYDVTTDEIRNLFADAKIALVKLRFGLDENEESEVANEEQQDSTDTKSPGQKKKRRIPTGSALVEFETIQDLEKAAAHVLTMKDGETLQPERQLKIGDTVIEVMLLKEYVESKKKRKAETTNGKKKDRDAKNEGAADNEDTSSTPAKVFTVDWKPGCVIRIIGVPEECSREAILDTVARGMDMTIEDVKKKSIYADYSRGQTDGAIRFPEPDPKIQELCDKLNSGTLDVAGSKVESAKILDGKEEKSYWDAFLDFKNKQIQQRAEERSSKKKRPRRG